MTCRTGRRWWNHRRSRTKRSTVAARFAPVTTASSTQRAGGGDHVEAGERAGGQGQTEPEHEQTLQMVPARVTAADAEREAPVGCRVGTAVTSASTLATWASIPTRNANRAR